MTEPRTTPPPYGGLPPSGASAPRASFGRRLVAFLVDSIVISIPTWIVSGLTTENATSLVGLAIAIAYYAYFEGSPSGQTAGKRLPGIRVIDLGTGESIGHGRAALRYLARFLSTIPCLLGYFWMLWDRENQTWHDKLANDVVVPTDAYPVASWPG